ncbi:MAG: Spy/CpxP family protein refolding chaperone [Longimicrobiaceae bacterium]
MKIRITLAAALLVAAACRSRQPQAGPQPAGSGGSPRDSVEREMFAAYRRAQMPSVFGLIGARERLKLTSPQVTALDSIAEAVREQNRPWTDSLRRFSRSGNGGPMRLPTNEAQQRDFTAILQKMGENTRRAVEAVRGVLNEEQRAGACTLAAEERRERGTRFGARGMGGGGGGMIGGRRQRGMMADSLGGRGMGGWPWCTRARPPQ